MDDISEWMLWMIWISKIRKKNAMIGFEPSQKKISHPSSQTCFNMWASRTTHRAMCLCVFSASSPSWSICWEVPKLDRWSLIATTKELSARYWKLFLYAWFSIDLKSLKKNSIFSTCQFHRFTHVRGKVQSNATWLKVHSLRPSGSPIHICRCP